MSKITLAIDCGGSHIKIALLQDGRILGDRIIPNTNNITDLQSMQENAHELIADYGYTKHELLGVGLSLPGVVSYHDGTLLDLKEKYQWGIGFAFKKWMFDNFYNLPCVVENDARLGLLGELRYGVAQEYTNAVLFIVGTGIGSAAMIEGSLLRGGHYQAGILGGHMGCDIHGLPCNCGGIGCIEAQVGAWQLPHFLQQRPHFEKSILAAQHSLNYKVLFEAYEQEDEFAVRAVKDIIKYWGLGIVNLVHAYDPDVVVLSGGIMKSARHIVAPLAEYVQTHAWTTWGELAFKVASDTNSSPLLGIEALLKETLQEENCSEKI